MMEKVLSNRYDLLEVVGEGGMAVVYRALDRQENREVAVKVLRETHAMDKDYVSRFSREATAASTLEHPNIVKVYDVGLDGDVRYMVMEYVRGCTLKELIVKRGRLEMNEAVRTTLKILAAVDCAHRNHVIHRDIKPQNILVSNKGEIKVTDFGIARVTEGKTQTYYTRNGNLLGSVHYFSPEQASGQLADEKSDLYSVGVVLFEMLTGQVLFDGETPVAVALKQLQERPRSARSVAPDNVTKALDEVLIKALDKDAANRYQTAGQMASDLKEAVRNPNGGFIRNPAQINTVEIEARRNRRKKRLIRIRNIVITMLCLVLLATGGLIGMTLYSRNHVKVPSLSMMNLEEAEASLSQIGLSYTFEERHSDKIDAGLIIEQYPEAGTYAAKGDRVQLTISQGKGGFMMPKLLELTRAEAIAIIEEQKLTISDEDIILEVSDAPVGTVVAQTPAVNEMIEEGQAVQLHISGESSTVPNVVDLPLEDAESILTSAGYKVAIIEKYSDAEVSTVCAQSPAAETRQLLGSEVTLTVLVYSADRYRAQLALDLSVPEGGAHVICTMEEDGEEKEVFNENLSQSQTIHLDMVAYTQGMHTIRVYRGDKLLVETEVEFLPSET